MSRDVGIMPLIGFRARLHAEGVGKWQDSGGTHAKFGLSTTELLEALAFLQEQDLTNTVTALHFHIGSQVSDIRATKEAVKEATRLYSIYLTFVYASPLIGGWIADRGLGYRNSVLIGGLIFIGAARDTTLRAFDIDTGRVLWSGELPASAQATPMTYRARSGKQFVVIAAGGHTALGTKMGDHIVAFALP